MKKFLVILIFSFYFIAPSFAMAARTVPNLNPLQPIPQSDVAPSYKNNINSPNNPYNASQQLEQKQITPAIPDQQERSAEVLTPKPNNQTIVSSQSIWVYWILLLVGILGLGGILVYLYFRFRK